MAATRREDHLPDEGASYGAMLGYWMNVMGLSDGQLARKIGVDRSYPGKLRRGDKFPAPDTAGLIRKRLLETAEDPGWNGPHVLTEDEQCRMDELLRASYAREHTARQRTKPLPLPIEDTLAQFERGVAPAIEEPGASSAPSAVPRGLRGGAELEALIDACGDNPTYAEEVRRLVRQSRLLAMGDVPGVNTRGPHAGWAQPPDVVYLMCCKVQVPKKTIFGHWKFTTLRIIAVFTSVEHMLDAVHAAPRLAWDQALYAWRVEDPVVFVPTRAACVVEGSALIQDLGRHEWLGINMGSARQFKLPPSG